MAKSLNDILQRYSDVISGKLPASKIEPLTTGENPGVDYADKMKDGRDFVAMHTVEKHPDRNGNGDDVFKGSTTKAKMERHGHEPKPKDIQVYNKTQQVSEAKDNREYDYEGEMAVTKLKTIVRAAEHLIKMMEPNTNLPEWVQSKIVKAEDYISTAHDYLMSEMNEEVEFDPDKLPKKVKRDYMKNVPRWGDDEPKKPTKKKTKTVNIPRWGEEVEELDEGVGVRNRVRKAILVGAKSAKNDKEHDINKNIVVHLLGNREAGKTYDTAKKMVAKVAKEEVEELDEGGSQYRSAAGSGKNTNPNLSRLARKLAFEKPKSFRPPGEKSKAENRDILNAEVAKFMKKGGKIRKEEVEELDEGIDKTQVERKLRSKYMGGNPKVTFHRGVVKVNAAGKDFHHKITKGQVEDRPFMTVDEEYISEAKGKKSSPNTDNPDMEKIRKIAGPGKIMHREPWHPSHAGHNLYTHTDYSSNTPKIRAFKVHQKTGKVTEFKNYNPSFGEEVKELDEAKCNMTEAGKMCEVHGMKACAKEETKPSDEQPMYNGKKKKGKQLILDKELEEMATSQAQQKLMAMAYRYKQDPNSMPDASEQVKKLASTMTKKQLHDYAATKRKGLPDKVEESLADQRSAKATASEKAREKITAALEKRKLAKEQSAPAETVIRMPSGEVGDTGRV